MIQQQILASNELIKTRTIALEHRIEKSMKEKFNNVPGYHESTISEKISGVPNNCNQIEHIPHDI